MARKISEVINDLLPILGDGWKVYRKHCILKEHSDYHHTILQVTKQRGEYGLTVYFYCDKGRKISGTIINGGSEEKLKNDIADFLPVLNATSIDMVILNSDELPIKVKEEWVSVIF